MWQNKNHARARELFILPHIFNKLIQKNRPSIKSGRLEYLKYYLSFFFSTHWHVFSSKSLSIR